MIVYHSRMSLSSRDVAALAMSLIVYLYVDVMYVTTVRFEAYKQSVVDISGKWSPRAWAGILAYTCMAIVWTLVGGSLVLRNAFGDVLENVYARATVVGVVYALALYGIYNATLLAQFARYDVRLAMSDMAWGLFWSVVSFLMLAATRHLFSESSTPPHSD